MTLVQPLPAAQQIDWSRKDNCGRMGAASRLRSSSGRAVPVIRCHGPLLIRLAAQVRAARAALKVNVHFGGRRGLPSTRASVAQQGRSVVVVEIAVVQSGRMRRCVFRGGQAVLATVHNGVCGR
jgi:hypothetical protein